MHGGRRLLRITQTGMHAAHSVLAERCQNDTESRSITGHSTANKPHCEHAGFKELVTLRREKQYINLMLQRRPMRSL